MPSAHAHERLRTLPRFRIGHTSDFRGLTGCTVVLCEAGAVCGVDVRGSAAGTRELEPCRPGHIASILTPAGDTTDREGGHCVRGLCFRLPGREEALDEPAIPPPTPSPPQTPTHKSSTEHPAVGRPGPAASQLHEKAERSDGSDLSRLPHAERPRAATGRPLTLPDRALDLLGSSPLPHRAAAAPSAPS